MSKQHYDERNQQDFESVTERINEALLRIAEDDSIKATVSALAKQAQVHRNTISNRVWPLERLEAIKFQRKAEAERKRNKTLNEPKPVDVLTDRLERAHQEILYWFKKHREVTTLNEMANENVRFLARSRDSYKRKNQELERELEKLKAEYERICDLLNTVKDE